ncbi:unnamed protein product [Heterobilharzia americana]|nr:unnamed protein product [Heterobilharzia americana]
MRTRLSKTAYIYHKVVYMYRFSYISTTPYFGRCETRISSHFDCSSRDSTNTCPLDNFYCGLMPRFVMSNPVMGLNSLTAENRLYGSSLPLSQNMRGKDERFPSNQDKQSVGYCITRKSLCDGVMNCEDGKDEDVSRCQTIIGMRDLNIPLLTGDTSDPNNWLSGFLSLGIPASIAIAVSTIVIFTLGIGAVICCCHRCCRINEVHNNQYFDNRLQLRSGAFLSDTSSHPANGTNNPYGYCRSHHQDLISVNTSAQLSDRVNLISHVDSDQQNTHSNWQQNVHFPSDSMAARENYLQQRAYNVPTQYHQGVGHYLTASQHMNNEKGIQPHCVLQAPLKLSLMDTKGFDQNGPPGPPPALIHGALGSPYTYRRDPLCYTPPPYGACNVPPASSVTASSSRTGTTSGGPRESVKLKRDQAAVTTGHSNSGNGDGTCNGSNTELFSHQLSGIGSALHTNTPVETISHGGDLTSNGGIVYLGELYRPLSPQNSSLFQNENRGPSSVTTTGSGSSHDRKSRQYFLNEMRSHHSDCQAFMLRTHQSSLHDSAQSNSRRSKTSSHRHHHRVKHHKSTDPSHTISSGSHTLNNSRCAILSVLPQRTGDVHEQTFSQSPLSTATTNPSTAGAQNHQRVIYPVQL